jgi:hypothetical protein
MAVGAEDKGMTGGGGAVEAVVGESGLLAGNVTGGDLTMSILDCWGAEVACTGDIDLSRLVSTVISTAALRPQNDNRPPPIFFPLLGSVV